MKNYYNRKAQASMEFLMTYGWAILAAVLAIGVLGYYGVFSPGSTLPATCIVNPPMTCGEYLVTDGGATDTVRLIVRNGAGSGITVSNFSVAGCTADTSGIVVPDATDMDVTLTCGDLGSAGDVMNGDISIEYLRSGRSINETSTGNIRAALQ